MAMENRVSSLKNIAPAGQRCSILPRDTDVLLPMAPCRDLAAFDFPVISWLTVVLLSHTRPVITSLEGKLKVLEYPGSEIGYKQGASTLLCREVDQMIDAFLSA